jgi:non-specific serine/threonine protein kinase
MAAASAHTAAGLLAARRRDWPVARAAFERAAESGRADAVYQASQLANVAGVDLASGDDDRAAVGFTEALALLRASGVAPSWIIARTLTALGQTACRGRDPDRAAAAFREALALGHGVGSPADVARALAGLGWVACLRQEWPRAARRFGAAAGLGETHHLAAGDAAARGHQDELIAQTQAALGAGDFAAAWEAGQAMPLEQAVASALEAEAAPTPA